MARLYSLSALGQSQSYPLIHAKESWASARESSISSAFVAAVLALGYASRGERKTAVYKVAIGVCQSRVGQCIVGIDFNRLLEVLETFLLFLEGRLYRKEAALEISLVSLRIDRAGGGQARLLLRGDLQFDLTRNGRHDLVL